MRSSNITIKVAVADNAVIVRNGLSAVLHRTQSIRVVPYEVNTKEALSEYIVTHVPDVVIVNPMFDGIFDLKSFKAAIKCEKGIKWMALTTSVITDNVLKDYDAAISLFDSADDITTRISNLVLGDEEDNDAGQESLSQRELEIVSCVARGMTNKEIAEKLFLSIHTVITHRRNISRKLQIHSPAGLTIYAIVNKLVDIKEIKS